MTCLALLFLPLAALAAVVCAEPAPPANGNEKEKPAASGIDALEVVKVTFVPFRRGGIVRPDNYVTFRYKWVQPGGPKTPDFTKLSGQTFSLPPDDGKKYRVLEIMIHGVVLELPDGTKKTLGLPK